MTNVHIIGEATPIEKKKPIKFVKSIYVHSNPLTTSSPNEWKNIELICNDYLDGYDLMFAYNRNREYGVAYFGHFNDGIVEEGVGND